MHIQKDRCIVSYSQIKMEGELLINFLYVHYLELLKIILIVNVKIMKTILLFLKKNWRWLLPVVFFAVWYFGLEKHWTDFVAGVVFQSFVWYAWTHYLKNKL